jgi:hypothetical protein
LSNEVEAIEYVASMSKREPEQLCALYVFSINDTLGPENVRFFRVLTEIKYDVVYQFKFFDKLVSNFVTSRIIVNPVSSC